MPLKSKLVESLHRLKNLEYTNPSVARASDSIVDNTLNILFQVGLKRTEFTSSEKKQIGDLLVDAIRPIQINIEATRCRYRTRLENAVLKKRSVLQFLVEDFARFPAGSSTLIVELEKNHIKESIKILDGIIVTYRDMSDSDEGASDREVGSSLPKTHTWWFS